MGIRACGDWLRRRRFELGIALLSTAVSVCMVEVGARLYYVATYPSALQLRATQYQMPRTGSTVQLIDILRPSADPKIVFELKPDLDVVFMGAPLRTNAEGWREREPSPPQAAAIRIAGIGDSFMFGWGVAEDARYLNLLPAQLAQRVPGYTFETAAFAVPGYNLVMEVEMLQRYVRPWHPDLIIYGYYENDYCLPNFIAPKKSLFAPELFIRAYLSGAPWWRSALQPRDDVVEHAYQDFEAHYCVEENVQATYRDLVGKNNFYRALRELGDVGRSLDVPVVFLKHLPCARFDGQPVPAGIDYIDPGPTYQRYLQEHGITGLRQSELVRGPFDPHPSAKGHQVIADALADQLIARGILDRAIASASRREQR
jgi:hypothetical protein